jgi:hypothetical protein
VSDRQPVNEAAELTREQIGPFLLLGVDKDADGEEIEANWARCVIAARKKQSRTPLPDVNWAREVLNDPDRRVRADVESLNADTTEQTLRELEAKFALAWEPVDIDTLPDFSPAADVPNAEALRRSITVPELPREFPIVAALLEQLAREPLDPWEFKLPAEGEAQAQHP